MSLNKKQLVHLFDCSLMGGSLQQKAAIQTIVPVFNGLFSKFWANVLICEQNHRLVQLTEAAVRHPTLQILWSCTCESLQIIWGLSPFFLDNVTNVDESQPQSVYSNFINIVCINRLKFNTALPWALNNTHDVFLEYRSAGKTSLWSLDWDLLPNSDGTSSHLQRKTRIVLNEKVETASKAFVLFTLTTWKHKARAHQLAFVSMSSRNLAHHHKSQLFIKCMKI